MYVCTFAYTRTHNVHDNIDYGRSRWIVPGRPVVSPSARPATWCHVG
jgi:hypothetical protein